MRIYRRRKNVSDFRLSLDQREIDRTKTKIKNTTATRRRKKERKNTVKGEKRRFVFKALSRYTHTHMN